MVRTRPCSLLCRSHPPGTYWINQRLDLPLLLAITQSSSTGWCLTQLFLTPPGPRTCLAQQSGHSTTVLFSQWFHWHWLQWGFWILCTAVLCLWVRAMNSSSTPLKRSVSVRFLSLLHNVCVKYWQIFHSALWHLFNRAPKPANCWASEIYSV